MINKSDAIISREALNNFKEDSMNEMKTAKTFGITSSILSLTATVLISIDFYVFHNNILILILSYSIFIANLIFLMLSIRPLSKIYQNNAIFLYYIVSFFIIIIDEYHALMGKIITYFNFIYVDINNFNAQQKEIFIIYIATALLIPVIGAYFFAKSFKLIGNSAGIKFFKISGSLYFYQTVLALLSLNVLNYFILYLHVNKNSANVNIFNSVFLIIITVLSAISSLSALTGFLKLPSKE